jgi:hypothetical protein
MRPGGHSRPLRTTEPAGPLAQKGQHMDDIIDILTEKREKIR